MGLQDEIQAQLKLEEQSRLREDRYALRQLNSPSSISIIRESISSGSLKLKSDLKKSSALVKKLKIICENNMSSILKDVTELNLTRYIDECIFSLSEATFKTQDLQGMISVISILHQRYVDFSSEFITQLIAVYSPSTKKMTPVEMKSYMTKRRMHLRLLAELYYVAIVDKVEIIVDILKTVIGKETKSGIHLDVPLLVSFAKYAGSEFFGRVSKNQMDILNASQSIETDIDPKYQFVNATVQGVVVEQYLYAFALMSKMFVAEYTVLLQRRDRNEKEKLNRGEVTEKHALEMEKSQKLFDKLQQSVMALAEALNEPEPELPEEKLDLDQKASGLSLWEGDRSESEEHFGPFDDVETKMFYLDLPDLLSVVPATLLGLSEKEVTDLKSKHASDLLALHGKNDVKEEQDKDIIPLEEKEPVTKQPNEVEENETTSSSSPVSGGGSAFEMYLEKFESMVNLDRCDQAAMDYWYHNNKGTRKRIIRKLYEVPWTHTQLLPYYARFLAILKPILPEIGEGVVDLLVKSFHAYLAQKNQYRLDSKVRNVRYLAELIKFNVAPPNVGFRCLKKCLDDFQGHNIDLATTFFENAGRFLFRTAHTHDRLVNFLDIMMRIKGAKHMDSRSETLIQNAYYMCQPPTLAQVEIKKEDPIYLYMLHLLQDTSNENARQRADKAVKQLRTLPWDREEVVLWFHRAVHYVIGGGKFYRLVHVAEIIFRLKRWYEQMVIDIIDEVLECLHTGLEHADYRENQKLLGYAKFIGDCYTTGFLNATMIFDTLYFTLHYGHHIPTHQAATVPGHVLKEEQKELYKLVPDLAYDPRIPCPFDEPKYHFRIRLVCILLESCGNHFGTGTTRAFLDRFVAFLFRYLYCKSDVPLGVEFAVLDLVEGFKFPSRIRVAIYDNIDTAEAQVQTYLKKEVDMAHEYMLKKKNSRTDSPPRPYESDGEEEDFEEYEECPAVVVSEEDAAMSGESEESSDESDDDEENEVSESEEEEEEAHPSGENKTWEDEDFELAFKSMMRGSAESRKHLPRAGNADNMAMPTFMKSTLPPSLPPSNSKVFRVLKRGNKGKIEIRDVCVPTDSRLAVQNTRQENAERQQHSEMKRLVLQNVEREALGMTVDEDDDELLDPVELPPPPPGPILPPSTSWSVRQSQRSRRGRRPQERGPSGTSSSTRGRGIERGLSDIHYRL